MSNLQALLSVAQIQMEQADKEELGVHFSVAQRHIVEMFYKSIGVVDPQAKSSEYIKLIEKLKEWCDFSNFHVASQTCEECIGFEAHLFDTLD